MQNNIRTSSKRLGSFPRWSVVTSITLALVLMGIFGLLLSYGKELERTIHDNIRLQVYLKSHLTDSARLLLKQKIANLPFVTPGEGSVVFVSRDEAARQFIKDTGEDFTRLLGENPLRDAFLVKVSSQYHEPAALSKIKGSIEQQEGVFQVYYLENLIDSLNKNLTSISLVLVGLGALSFVLVALLINNTIRLALFSQRFLIRSMQLVGATNWFIQKPFLLRSALYGLVSALVAAGILLMSLKYVHGLIPELQLIRNDERVWLILGSLAPLGIFVAVFSTWRAVNRYLKLSLDELY